MTAIVIDNDVLIKGAAYELLAQLISAVPATEEEVGLLGAARYLVPDRLRKTQLNKAHEIALQHFDELAKKASFLEPTEEESKLAGELEFLAQRANLPLDAGESQLLALVVVRSLDKFVTGDKRAIAAMETVSGGVINIEIIRGKVLCLEQLFHRLLDKIDRKTVRECICKEPQIDKALSICFSCNRADSASDNWLAGLESYISDLRKQAEVLLSP